MQGRGLSNYRFRLADAPILQMHPSICEENFPAHESTLLDRTVLFLQVGEWVVSE